MFLSYSVVIRDGNKYSIESKVVLDGFTQEIQSVQDIQALDGARIVASDSSIILTLLGTPS